jgi:hypothetical protein
MRFNAPMRVVPDALGVALDPQLTIRAMRLQAKEPKVALHAALGDTGLGGHRAHAPVRRAFSRLGVQRRIDQLGMRSSSMLRGAPGRTSS